MKEILDFLNKNGIVVECNGYFDYVLFSWLTDQRSYNVYNTKFLPEQVDKIVFERGKYPVIFLQ